MYTPEQMRAAFEDQMRSVWGGDSFHAERHPKAPDEYLKAPEQMAWVGWQAANAYAATLRKNPERGVTEATPNDDAGHEWAKKHHLFVYEVDFGDEGKGRYVRLGDFNKVVAALEAALSAEPAAPCSLNEALAVIESWTDHGGQVHGSAAVRFRTLVDRIAHEPAAQGEATCKHPLLVAGYAAVDEACRRAFCAEDGYGEGRLGSRDYRVFRDGFFCGLNEPFGNPEQLPEPAAWIIRKRNTHPMDSVAHCTTHDGDAAYHIERGDDVTPLYTAPPAQPAERVPEGCVAVRRSMLAETVRVLKDVDTQVRATGQPSGQVERLVNFLAPFAASPAPSPARVDGGEG